LPAVLTRLGGLRLGIAGGDAQHGPGWLAPASVALALGGILLAWATYQRGAVDPARLAGTFPLSLLDFLARRRYGLDALYDGLYRGFILGFSRLIGWIDRSLVGGVLNFLSAWRLRAGERLRRIASGQAQ